MNRIGEFVAYQAVWFVAVIGAGAGLGWAGPLAAAPLAAWQVASAPRPPRTALLGAVGLGCGLVVDGGFAAVGLVRHAAGGALAPAWILALWVVFAMTLHRSFALLQRRPGLAAVLGAVGGPLAYLGAARGWDAVTFAEPATAGLVALGIAWGITLPVLAFVARATAAEPRDASLEERAT